MIKVGDRIRRIGNAARWAPIGYETTATGDNDNLTYTDATGDEGVLLRTQDWELVSPTGPVVTETVKRIVDWSGDDVTVSVHPDGEISIDVRMLTRKPERVKATIAVLTQLADALEDK
jgi:hypothetical protein